MSKRTNETFTWDVAPICHHYDCGTELCGSATCKCHGDKKNTNGKSLVFFFLLHFATIL